MKKIFKVVALALHISQLCLLAKLYKRKIKKNSRTKNFSQKNSYKTGKYIKLNKNERKREWNEVF